MPVPIDAKDMTFVHVNLLRKLPIPPRMVSLMFPQVFKSSANVICLQMLRGSFLISNVRFLAVFPGEHSNLSLLYDF